MIRSFVGLIRNLQSNASPAEVASGAVLSLYIGFTPWTGSHQLFLFLLFFFLKVNRAATLLLLPLMKLITLLGISALADTIGFYLLTEVPALAGFWAWVTRAPVLAYLNLNQTVVLGGFVIALALSAPVYFLMGWLIGLYRRSLGQKVARWQVTRWLNGLGIVKWISSWWPKAE
ncbi:MAG: TIGR03546 family protein [Candidatus Omnitrophota bacterium]